MLETAKLNLRLIMADWKTEIYKAQEKAVIASYMLTTDALRFITLAFLAMLAIVLDSATTALILLSGGMELNPLALWIMTQGAPYVDVVGVNNYIFSQTLLAYVIFFGAIIYAVAVIMLNAYMAEEAEKYKEQIRSVSKTMKWLFIWVICIRGFAVGWNLLVIGGVRLL